MGEAKYQKSYFDVLGLCCSSEIALIEKILKPLEGIQKVSVIVPSKTVIVVHDSSIVSQLQIVKALNQARLEATIRTYGTGKIVNKWPSPYIVACGALLLVSMFQRLFRPLQWLAIAAVGVGLPPILLRSIASIRRFNLDINILMLIAVGGAVGMRDYTEAGLIVFLFTTAEWLESMASHKATAGMTTLMNMAPQKAILAETGQVVDAREVKINTTLAVKAGELIPIDGVVVDGFSEVDERTLTGESFPVAKQAQSLVWAGTLNIDGYISVKTTALADNSAVAKMARLVEEAQNNRSKTQRIIDSCAKYYTPVLVIIAAGIALVPLIVKAHHRRHWFQLALVLLVSACPCALVLSTPVATFCALLKAVREGLLIKGGDVLEALANANVVAFDKTGTITRGEFTVTEFRPINSSISMEKLLYWVSSIESKSSHPMAAALMDYAQWKSVKPKPDNVGEFHIHTGEGIHGKIDGNNIYIGNKRIAIRAGCQTVPKMENVKQGVTVGYVFSNAVPIGIFTISDTCRTGAAEAMKELKSLGVKIAMLTGDSTGAAMHVQDQLGNAIETIHAELLPEDKVRIVKDLKIKEGSTVMVGDGMNDAPALAMADVGISMGISGSAVAMETSHITLMSNDISKIPSAIQLARRTRLKIIWNILFSATTKIAIMVLAFAGHPLLWAAVLADVGTCLLVILNSMMLLRTKAPQKKCCRSGNKLQAGNDCHDHCNTLEHGCHGNDNADEQSCCGNPHKNGYHDDEKTYEHACHEHGKAQSSSCRDQKKEHEHGGHDHGNAHARGCHEHQSMQEHGCHDNKKVSVHSCHDHGKAHEHGCHGKNQGHIYEHNCHEHGKVHSGSCLDRKKEHEHGGHDHGNAHACGCHEHQSMQEHGCHDNKKVSVHSCHDHGKAHEHGCHGKNQGHIYEHNCHDTKKSCEHACHHHKNVHNFDCHNHAKVNGCSSNENMKAEEIKNNSYSSRCKKQGCCPSSQDNSHCCAVSVPLGVGHQNIESDVTRDGSSCEAVATGNEVVNDTVSCRSAMNSKTKYTSACCTSIKRECGKQDASCCSEINTKRKNIGEHRTSIKNECGRKDGMRESGWCCRSYKMERGKRNGCCAGETVQPPEIVIE